MVQKVSKKLIPFLFFFWKHYFLKKNFFLPRKKITCSSVSPGIKSGNCTISYQKIGMRWNFVTHRLCICFGVVYHFYTRIELITLASLKNQKEMNRYLNKNFHWCSYNILIAKIYKLWHSRYRGERARCAA